MEVTKLSAFFCVAYNYDYWKMINIIKLDSTEFSMFKIWDCFQFGILCFLWGVGARMSVLAHLIRTQNKT